MTGHVGVAALAADLATFCVMLALLGPQAEANPVVIASLAVGPLGLALVLAGKAVLLAYITSLPRWVGPGHAGELAAVAWVALICGGLGVAANMVTIAWAVL